MNTHSRVSDARRETLAAHTALCGGDRTVVEAVFLAITTDEAVDILDRAGLREPVMASLAGALDQRLKARAGEDMDIGHFFLQQAWDTGPDAGSGAAGRAPRPGLRPFQTERKRKL